MGSSESGAAEASDLRLASLCRTPGRFATAASVTLGLGKFRSLMRLLFLFLTLGLFLRRLGFFPHLDRDIIGLVGPRGAAAIGD
jgi:hypothetical protein